MRGFTLIELLITLAIFGLLLTFAYPAYTQHITKAHRSDAHIALLDLAARMERYYAENNSYQNATLAKLHVDAVTPQGFYTLGIAHASENEFLLTASPNGTQALKDVVCGELTYNELGQKGQAGKGTLTECWG